MNKKIVLTVNKFSEIPVEGHVHLLQFDAVSMKFAEWKKLGNKIHGLFIKERHAWEWATFKNENNAAIEGTRLGKACAVYNIDTFYINAEAEWAGVAPFVHNGNPYKNMEIFITHFRRHAPKTTKLAYNGFSWAKNSDGRLLHDKELMKKFDIWVPMLYSAIRELGGRKITKYDMPRMPMFGVGRIDKDGKVWGHWEETMELLKKYHVDGICLYFGNGARPHFLTGHSLYPSVVESIPKFRRLWED